MATFTADKAKAGIGARKVHAGTNTVVSTFMWGVTNADDTTTSATAEAGDVIKMVKLPHGATVTRVAYVGNRDDGAYKLGTSASASLFDATVSLSAGITSAVIGLPHEVSVTDSLSDRVEYLTATVVSAGYTLSDFITVIVDYTLDN